MAHKCYKNAMMDSLEISIDAGGENTYASYKYITSMALPANASNELINLVYGTTHITEQIEKAF